MVFENRQRLTQMLYRKRHHFNNDDVEIPISPLIDCVFLLLIFFLVTTMLKRKETIIPVVMPESASSITQTANEDVLVVGLDREGRFLEPSGRDPYGALLYRDHTDLSTYLDEMITRSGAGIFEKPIRFDVDRNTPFQKTITALDTFTLRGFRNVSVKLRPPSDVEQ